MTFSISLSDGILTNLLGSFYTTRSANGFSNPS